MTIVTDKSLISSESRMYFLMKVRKIGSQNIAICGVYCHQEGLSMLDIKSKNISYLKSHQCKNVNNQISFNVFVKIVICWDWTCTRDCYQSIFLSQKHFDMLTLKVTVY